MEKFVPKPYKKEQITLRIDVDKLERMETLARRFEISRSEQMCIRDSPLRKRLFLPYGGNREPVGNSGPKERFSDRPD